MKSMSAHHLRRKGRVKRHKLLENTSLPKWESKSTQKHSQPKELSFSYKKKEFLYSSGNSIQNLCLIL